MNRAKKIFIVEDDPQMLELLKTRLEVAGYVTAYAKDGIAAVPGIANTLPDAILLNIGLPYCDGFEVLSTIRGRAALRHIPVLMISARHSEGDVQRAILCGAQDYIAKPFNDQLLLSRVARLVQTTVPNRADDSVWDV